MFEIKSGRIKPKKEAMFGKKPYAGKDKNRTGKKSVTVTAARIKPKFDGSNEYDMDILNRELTIRFSSHHLKLRVEKIMEISICQICNNCNNIDYPHHAKYGLGVKDDRFLINICIFCHDTLHRVGYSNLLKTRKECEEIGWKNHLCILGGSDVNSK